ncbi:MAG: glycosyltransferase family 2 protein [Methylacidiphilales bacterium]|nr:glycosyltransferase family 2 protein [Candidatus Methylacidiphilales bacterium]
MKISACIITLNEESDLPRCLASLKPVADEIVIVDSGSTDRTPFIATDHNARFIRHDWEGYVAQKNFALQKATGDWILSIDADEELSPELRDEILKLKEAGKDPEATGFDVSRVVFYENKWIRFGDWYPDRLVRLFRRDRARFEGGAVHERLEIQGPVQSLKGELYHYTYRNLADQMACIENYSTLWASSAFKEGKRAGLLTPYLHAIVRFLRAFILKGGFKGGLLGWRIASLNAREVYLKYKKLRNLANSPGSV